MDFVSIRVIDDLGRIVLPVDVRKFYSLNEGDSVSIKISGSEIFIVKGRAENCKVKVIDKIGRIVIPKTMRKELNITKVKIIPSENGIRLCKADES